MRLESAGCDFQARRAQPVGKILIKPVGRFRRSRIRKRRAIAFAAVAVQSELGDHEDFAAAVDDRAVHLALVVFEDAKLPNFVGERVGVFLGILFAYTEQDTKSGSNLTDFFPAHANAGLGDSLHNGSHGENQRDLKKAGDILSLPKYTSAVFHSLKCLAYLVNRESQI